MSWLRILSRLFVMIMGKKKINDANRMRVSFDLDEVLFVLPETHKTEDELPFPYNKIYKERLRLGTPSLIRRLQNENFEVWVYTSSFRTEKYIRKLFKQYHVEFDGIINGNRHLREVQGNRKDSLPQKLPSKYRISLHIDDESIIVTSGKLYGFNVYQLNAQDDDWEEKIMERVYQIRRRERPDLIASEEVTGQENRENV